MKRPAHAHAPNDRPDASGEAPPVDAAEARRALRVLARLAEDGRLALHLRCERCRGEVVRVGARFWCPRCSPKGKPN